MSQRPTVMDFMSPRGSPLSTIWGDRSSNFTNSPLDSAFPSTPVGLNIITEEDATSTLNVDLSETAETAEEAIETGSEVTSAIEGLVDPVQLIGAAVQAGSNAISSSEDASLLSQGRGDFINAEAYGHGVGYQTVAQNNFNNVQNAVGVHQAFTSALNFLGPLGSIIGALVQPSAFMSSPSSSFMAQTTSGTSVDAQSADIVNTT